MRNLELTIVSFKQWGNEPEYLYALNGDREPEIGEYYYRENYGPFAKIQQCYSLTQMAIHGIAPVIEATTNPKYDLPRIPPVFVTAYFENNRQPNKIQLRLPDLKTEKV